MNDLLGSFRAPLNRLQLLDASTFEVLYEYALFNGRVGMLSMPTGATAMVERPVWSWIDGAEPKNPSNGLYLNVRLPPFHGNWAELTNRIDNEWR